VITLKDNDSGAFIGTITEDQLQFLIDELVEETSDDQDYWINRATLDLFRDDKGDPALIALIEKAMGERDDIEIAWESE